MQGPCCRCHGLTGCLDSLAPRPAAGEEPQPCPLGGLKTLHRRQSGIPGSKTRWIHGLCCLPVGFINEEHCDYLAKTQENLW